MQVKPKPKPKSKKKLVVKKPLKEEKQFVKETHSPEKKSKKLKTKRK